MRAAWVGLAVGLGLALLGGVGCALGAEALLPWLSGGAELFITDPQDVFRFRVHHGVAGAVPGVMAAGLMLALLWSKRPMGGAPMAGVVALPVGAFALGVAWKLATLAALQAVDMEIQPMLSLAGLTLYKPAVTWTVGISVLAALALVLRKR